jgi:hypothetical protein
MIYFGTEAGRKVPRVGLIRGQLRVRKRVAKRMGTAV